MSTPLVSMRGISKTIHHGARRLEVLRNVHLDVDAGEFLAITGASGSGKSTLLHILGTLDRPSEGEYQLGGWEVSSLCDDARARIRGIRIGFVFQSFHLVPQLSIIENVAMPLLYFRKGTGDARERAAHALGRVGLSGRLDHRPAQLSGGEMQRAAIARALVTDPELVLADEPTGNLDSSTARQILDLLGEANGRGVTLILVTHDEAIAARARRRARMSDGCLDQ